VTKKELYTPVLHSYFARHTILTTNLNQATRHFCWGAWTVWHKTADQEYMHIFDLFCQVGSTRWM